MLNKAIFARQLVLMNNTSKLMTTFALRGFYYPDANHHHLNQEVRLNHCWLSMHSNHLTNKSFNSP